MTPVTRRSIAEGRSDNAIAGGSHEAVAISAPATLESVRNIMEQSPLPRRPNRVRPQDGNLTPDDLDLIAIDPPAEWLVEKNWE